MSCKWRISNIRISSYSVAACTAVHITIYSLLIDWHDLFLPCAMKEEPSKRHGVDTADNSVSERPPLIAHYLYIQVSRCKATTYVNANGQSNHFYSFKPILNNWHWMTFCLTLSKTAINPSSRPLTNHNIDFKKVVPIKLFLTVKNTKILHKTEAFGRKSL